MLAAFHGFKGFLKLLADPIEVAGGADENRWMRAAGANSPRCDSHDRIFPNNWTAGVAAARTSVVRGSHADFFSRDESSRSSSSHQLRTGDVRDGHHVQALQLVGTVTKEGLERKASGD